VFASDPSAVIEHTKNVLVLEDGDLVHVCNGNLQARRATILFLSY
jgi:glucosamine--fructose-6-phosphate aminotransferase (isomerizing)